MRNINDNSQNKISQQQIQDWDKKIKSLPRSVRLVANYYFGTSNIRKSIFVSQTLVAKKLGLSRETVNRALKLLHELGFITKIDRGWKEDRTRIKKTCYYIINKLFFYQEIRDRYKHIFLALSYMVIFCNFESVFGIWKESERQQYNEVVTGIKFSSYKLFINKEAAYNSIKFQRRRRLLKGERLKQSGSITKIERDTVMSQFTLPRVLQEAAFLNLAAKMDLAVFNEIVISHALAKLAVAKDIGRPYAYVKGICKSETTKRGLSIRNRSEVPIVEGEAELDISAFRQARPSATIGKSADSQKSYTKKEELRVMASAAIVPESTLSDRDKEQKRKKFKGLQACLDITTDIKLAVDYQREMNLMKSKYPYLFGNETTQRRPAEQIETLTYLANNIAKAIDMYKPNQYLPLTTLVKGLFNVPYRLTGEADEELAKEYMNHIAKKFGLDIPFLETKPTINTPKLEPESITINESDYDEVLD